MGLLRRIRRRAARRALKKLGLVEMLEMIWRG